MSVLRCRILAPYVPLLVSRSVSVPALKLYTLYNIMADWKRFAIAYCANRFYPFSEGYYSRGFFKGQYWKTPCCMV